ncbi:DNA adenine methylase [Methanospirillum hungatei]|uniref:DNA adenine methylase n=1 Tax=Methanospirillum hungatei TaxID=2203 RepID=UPI0026F36938|nr:DNA adenine methylase [Methanospirillum hungatei]MCA1915224.1 DNA adenine methylase [Methanospirillum hungatei]
MKKGKQNLIKSIRGRRTSGGEEYAKPFFKWAGGKSQLLYEFDPRFPKTLETGDLSRYVEPFVGGGAVFFYIAQLYPIKEAVICDVNSELILTWKVVKQDVNTLIRLLQELQEAYDARDEAERLNLFYQVRDDLNREKPSFDYDTYGDHTIQRASQLLFLNRTCFNGLFRLNSKGEFNVPFGKYKNPTIVQEKNLLMASNLLTHTTILQGDFTTCLEYVTKNSFVYLDPPYRPLNKTSSFTGYSQEGFSEQDQLRLCDFFLAVDTTGAKVMLSNSDPRNEDPTDHFFDDLYKDFLIERVLAKRFINSVGEKRGDINELIIRNYQD